MRTFLDFSLFQYKCINFDKNDIHFTYKSKESRVKQLNKDFFYYLNEISLSTNFAGDFMYKSHNHPIDNEKKELIFKILKRFGVSDDNIEQKYDSTLIWQIKIKNSVRLFFIIDKIPNSSNSIIKPILLDINHVIYNDSKFSKKYELCWVCYDKKC